MNASEMKALTDSIATALGDPWKRKQEDDTWDASCRTHLTHPTHGDLYVSNSWGGKGRLYLSGSLPTGITQPYKWENPSITVDINKEPERIARDIKARLLPAWDAALAAALKAHVEKMEWEKGCSDLREQVAVIKGGYVRGEMVFGPGHWDIQVSSPTSMRLYGNCVYITLEQLRKIKEVCPELFGKVQS